MSTPATSLVRLDLGGSWTCRATGGPVPPELAGPLASGVPATVPGVVHTDLMAAGLIPDPYDGANERALTWIGEVDWEYTRSFAWTANGHARHDLVAHGLDTVATVWLNGVRIGTAANHHRTYRFDVTGVLREGTNELRVVFTSALRYAREQSAALGPRPHTNTHPYNAIRKPAYAFGWDWGPELVTAGIWREIAVESWTGARIAAVRPLTGYDAKNGGLLTVHVDGEVDGGAGGLRVEVGVWGEEVDAGAAMPVRGPVRVVLPVPCARPWWPRGYGEQPLYEVTVTLLAGDGTPRDAWSGRVGFRSVTLDTSADEVGNRFSLRVNGREIYVRGANWIPDDTFLPRITRDSLRPRILDAAEAGMNLLRVWGGGIYESDDFYDLCDEHGLLVWQDFPLACAAYAEEEPLAGEFEAEARQAITRLCAHPSLAIWNGNNENLWGYADWNWRSRLQGATWGDGYYTELFPRLVAELSPGTPYSPGSPCSFDRYLHPNDAANGTMHIWDVWNTRDYTGYRAHRPRFAAEFGFQGPPAFTTLESVVHDEPRSPHGPHLLAHEKARDGIGKLTRGLGGHLPVPADYLDWHWATQLNQARAVRFGIEHFRSLAPLNTGAIVWQLNDCWPVISWAAVDSHGRRKPLWYALRAAFADRLATIQPRDDRLALIVHNDRDEPWETALTVRRLTVDGDALADGDGVLRVPPRASAEVFLDPGVAAAGCPAAEFLVADLGTGERALWYFTEDTRLDLRPDPLEAAAEPVPGGHRVTVRATSLVKDLTLLADHAHPDAVADRALLTLLPGETARITVTCDAPLDPETLTRRPVLRTANDLVAAAVERGEAPAAAK